MVKVSPHPASPSKVTSSTSGSGFVFFFLFVAVISGGDANIQVKYFCTLELCRPTYFVELSRPPIVLREFTWVVPIMGAV